MLQPPTDLPAPTTWREKRAAALTAAWLSLSPEEREVAAAARVLEREERKVRRRRNRERCRRLNLMVLAGSNPEEIAAAEGMNKSTLRSRLNGLFAARRGFRRLFAWISDDHVAALEEIAADLGIDRNRVLERLLAATLADAGLIARRQLGVRRRVAA